MEEQKDRLENTEPETDDVEGHRLAKDDPERAYDRNEGEPDVEAHRVVDRTFGENDEEGDERAAGRNLSGE